MVDKRPKSGFVLIKWEMGEAQLLLITLERALSLTQVLPPTADHVVGTYVGLTLFRSVQACTSALGIPAEGSWTERDETLPDYMVACCLAGDLQEKPF